ncbi:fatty acid hydroxylase [Trametes gibbosa]|nr:fatty acid hydroxylase [Trametes gibbosa]
MTTPIPSPPALPFLGHITHLDKEIPQRSFDLLADQYGEIYKLDLITRQSIFLASYELQDEASNEKRFEKAVIGALEEVRHGMGDGLFTAYPGEPNWGIAHRLLMPAFSTAKVRDMFPDMMDIASQMLVKWERFGPQHIIDPSEDFTLLAFDTIALCAMSYRLNTFYSEQAHPFVHAMSDFLTESAKRSNRPPIMNTIMRGSSAKYEEDMKTMNRLVDELIEDRKKNPVDKEDLLNIMLNKVDQKTRQRLSDEAIRNNLTTFLIAGHETTSGTLTFALYYLCKHPEAMRKLREEIDEVVGEGTLHLEDVPKLKYMSACLRETLRLNPPATIRVIRSVEDTTIGGGKYAIAKDAILAIITGKCQTDPKVWGEYAREFKPERMYGENFDNLPPNAWQPFGYGMRGCIGRPFAWQEAHIALARVLQKFDIVMDDPSYTLQLKQTMAMKPKGFYIHAIPRKRMSVPVAVSLSGPLAGATNGTRKSSSEASEENAEPKQKLYIVYGSNTGTSQTFAQRIASDAPSHGFKARLGTLDSISEHVPTDGPLIIVTASFEGEPADNAAHFFDWLQSSKGKEAEGVKYSVFGCGNRDWARTYQRVPKLIDALLEERGGKRLHERGSGDAQTAEFFQDFDEWEAQLWKALAKEYGFEAKEQKASVNGISFKTVDSDISRAAVLRQPDADLGRVVENRLLTSPNAPEKRHIEFLLPDSMTYRAGDYLSILPHNPPRDVHRVVSRFALSAEQQIVLASEGPTSLPVGKPINIFSLLSGYVEISQPATTRDLRSLLAVESSDATKAALEDLSASYAEKVMGPRLSILDILEDHVDIELPFATYLEMLPPMRARQYSISSSPLHDPQRPTLTVSVVEAPALSGRKEQFLGVASTFLASLRAGDMVQLAVRASAATFHPPEDVSVPMIMFAAGSGLSPMRGFLQERAAQKKAGREVARSTLFFGCRSPEEDYLYADSDLKEWQELGIVDVRPAFSRRPEESEGCKYVQDRAWKDRAIVHEAYDHQGARFFTCGSGKMAQGVKKMLTEFIKESRDCSDEEAARLFERAIQGRYATDIFE